MTTTTATNWIGDTWCAAAEEGFYEVASRAEPGRRLGRWPRSGAEDVRRALDAARRAAEGWRARRPAERRRVLAPVPGLLEAEGEALEAFLGDLLGLAPDEARRAAGRTGPGELERRLRAAPERAGNGRPAVLRAHWSELAGGLAARVLERLAAGTPVLVLADARVPAAADALARALAGAGVPAGVAAVLHDDGETALGALLSAPPDLLGEVDAAGTDDDLEALEERAARAGRAVLGRPVRNASMAVEAADDPADRAARAVELALGRSSTLSGQLPGQVARVLCHPLRFSRFTEELLSRLSASPDVVRAVPWIDESARRQAGDTRALGLDEGAALVFDRQEAGAGAGVSVFTNVEAESRLAGRTRPAPILSLVRAPGARRGA